MLTLERQRALLLYANTLICSPLTPPFPLFALSEIFRGGVRFPDLNKTQVLAFQDSILSTMLTLERTYLRLALLHEAEERGSDENRNVLILCDRGAMDASACMCNL